MNITIISEDTGDPLNKILGQVMTTESRIGQSADTNLEVAIEAKGFFTYVPCVSFLLNVFNLTWVILLIMLQFWNIAA